MMSGVLFAATLAGVFWPQLVVRRKAFGVSVILLVAELIGEVAGVTISYAWVHTLKSSLDQGGIWEPNVGAFILMAIAPVLKVAVAISLLVAYWPGGALLQIRRRSEGQVSD